MHQRHLLSELRLIQAKLRLKLPADRNSIHRQRLHLEQLQQQLEQLQEQVSWLTRRSLDDRIVELIGILLTDAKNFQLLAEEFLIDPEGSISCLQQVLQTRTQARSILLHPVSPSTTPSKINSQPCIKPTVWFRDDYSFPA